MLVMMVNPCREGIIRRRIAIAYTYYLLTSNVCATYL